jgi:hypothetical protein
MVRERRGDEREEDPMFGWRVSTIGIAVLAACSAAELPPGEGSAAALEQAVGRMIAEPDLEGIIRELLPEGWILVETKDAPEPRRVRIGFETHVQLADGLSGGWRDLAPDRRVTVWLRDSLSEVPAHRVEVADEDGG